MKKPLLNYVHIWYLFLFSAAGEIAFDNCLPQVVQQSSEVINVCVVRTKVMEGDIIQPWRVQPFSNTSK